MKLFTKIYRQNKDAAASMSIQLHTFVTALIYFETALCVDQISQLR